MRGMRTKSSTRNFIADISKRFALEESHSLPFISIDIFVLSGALNDPCWKSQAVLLEQAQKEAIVQLTWTDALFICRETHVRHAAISSFFRPDKGSSIVAKSSPRADIHDEGGSFLFYKHVPGEKSPRNKEQKNTKHTQEGIPRALYFSYTTAHIQECKQTPPALVAVKGS